MAKKLYEEADIQAIANAIRGKNGLTDTYKTREMAAAITNLPASGGSEPVISVLEITENGTYNAPESVDGYNPVTVNVPTNVMAKEITANGVYNPADDGVDGYSPVTVNVPTSGGGSGGVIVNRANPLPVCLPYHHHTGITGYQYNYLTFIWPAGVEQLYLNHDYAPSTFTASDGYKMSEITLDFGKNAQMTVPNSLTVPMFIIAPVGTADLTSSNNITLKRIISETGKIGNPNSTIMNFKFTLKASSYLGGTPTEDTLCVIQISTKGYNTPASMVGILTVQEEAFG